ncbi:MAG TPA: hypothetical protein VM369_03510 [Candidatus Binatia bacterium]|nr:hypothetical protein [Candidatus Binatia bacterium]
MAQPTQTPGSGKKGSENRDPITKTPGAHPVGTGVGAAAGGIAGAAAAGAAAGTVAGGPVGAAIGLAAGAVIGGLVGKGIAEKIDPTVEEAYWRESYRTEPYYQRDLTYDDYEPAYRTGYTNFGRYEGRSFDEVEGDLQSEYEQNRGKSRLGWDRAKQATRAAWDRVERTAKGDTDDNRG